MQRRALRMLLFLSVYEGGYLLLQQVCQISVGIYLKGLRLKSELKEYDVFHTHLNPLGRVGYSR